MVYFHRLLWSTKCVKLYLMGNLVLCISKSPLLLLCDSHNCCNDFTTSITIHYLRCIMGAKCRSPRPLGSWLGKLCVHLWCRASAWCQTIPWQIPQMGYQGASPTCHPAQHVLTCHWEGTKRGREVHPLRLMANPTPARSQGNLKSHTTGGLSDLSEGNLGSVPWGIPTKEATQPTTMQTLTEERSYPGHLVLTDEPFAEVGGANVLEEGQCRVAAIVHQPACHPEAQSRSHKRRSPHDKALQEAREAHQWVFEATYILELDIKRLILEAENPTLVPLQPQWQLHVKLIPW